MFSFKMGSSNLPDLYQGRNQMFYSQYISLHLAIFYFRNFAFFFFLLLT